MDAQRLADRIAWAGNRTARHIGVLTDAFRPAGVTPPLSTRNRYLRLPAIFSSAPTSLNQAARHGDPICYGHFDSSYTRPGDYLVQPDLTAFIAAQEPLQPVVCVRTNSQLTVRRVAAPSAIGTNAYGGVNPEGAQIVIQNWPASILGIGTGGTSPAGLPSDSTLPQWTVLLPHLGTVRITSGDLVSDAVNLRAVVIAAEHSFLGWRLTARQASA